MTSHKYECYERQMDAKKTLCPKYMICHSTFYLPVLSTLDVKTIVCQLHDVSNKNIRSFEHKGRQMDVEFTLCENYIMMPNYIFQ